MSDSDPDDPRHLGSRSSSSWIRSADVEIQRDLVASRVFEGQPLTIDHFVIEKLVGSGSSAAVYAARDTVLERPVAIKVLPRIREGRADAAVERCLREARAQARVSHRNVVTIYGVGEWNHHPFIIMDLIEGATLAQWLAASRRTVPEILAVFREAGCGLAAAHAHGQVHRDFKPANVLVARDGRVVVSDFGLVDHAVGADATNEATNDAASSADCNGLRRPVGTPAYVAPEQRAGAAPRESADVYSFALTLVEAVLGYHPMPESTTKWKSALRRHVPRRLRRILCTAMEPDPQQRLQSLGPLLDALALPRPGRQRRAAGMLAAGVAAVLVAATLSWNFGSRDSHGAQESAQLAALLPAEIFKEVEALLAAPPEQRDRRWDERARTVLMLPIPTRVPCRWATPPRVAEIVGDQVVALDLQGRVMSCAITTGIVTPIADEVICLRRADDTMLGVAFRDGKIAMFQHRTAGWSSVPLAGSPTIADIITPGMTDCPFNVVSRSIPLQISVSRPSRSEMTVMTSGGRKISRKLDGSLWVQSGDAAPELLVPVGSNFRFDMALHHGVVTTPTRVQIFDLTTASLIADERIPSSSDYLSAMTDIARDGSVAVALGTEQRLLWWRRGERQWRSQLIETGIADLTLGPGGERVLIRRAGELQVRDLESGRSYPLAAANMMRARFSNDDQVVAVDTYGSVWRWSLNRFRSSVLADHAGGAWMWGFAICDQGRAVVTATNRMDRAIVISSPGGAPQQTLVKPPNAQIYSLICQDDRILAGTRDGRLLEWEWPSGRLIVERDTGVRAWIWTLATARPVGGDRVDFIGTGELRNTRRSGSRVFVLRAGVLSEIFMARSAGCTGIDEIVVSSDGLRAAAVACSGELALIDTISATAIRSRVAHAGEIRRVRFVNGDRIVVTGGDDGYLRTWRANDLERQREIYVGHGVIDDLDVHDNTALVATYNGHVGTWDLDTGRLVRTHRRYLKPAMARFDASGRWIVSGDFDGHACVHRADRDGCYVELVGHKPSKTVRHLKVLDDGQIITGSEDGTVRQWNPPLEASSAELACELQSYLFDGERGEALASC